jgi:periplasmic protein TonB
MCVFITKTNFMIRTTLFSKKYIAFVILLAGIGFASCNNNDTNDTSTATSTDTSLISVDQVNTGVDSGMAANPADTASTATMTGTTGTAKPDPAKKGKKGKVVLGNAPKNTGAMEMDQQGVYSNVEVLPSFPGGNKGLQRYFDDNLVYPTSANDEGVDGVVNVTFTVDETGKLSAPTIGGQKLGYGLEEEALRVVNTMPKWNPGTLKGKNVKTRFTLPVRFELY